MGGERTGTGKYVRFYVAILTCLLLSQCTAAVDRSPLLQRLVPQDEVSQHLAQARKLFSEGKYEAALEENEKALSLSGNGSPGDQALYNMGLIYAHPDNPKRDYVKSISLFDRLIREYSQGPWVEQARVWVLVLGETEEFKRPRSPAVEQPRTEVHRHLAQARKLFSEGKYEAALEENEKALSLSGNGSPGDQALYNMGLIYANPGNSKRDYVKSIAFFRRLIKEYGQSARAELAKIWVQLIQDSENAKRVAATLTQENDKLKRMIEESRKVDIEIEEKKREQAR